jgi:hypothetical protein
MPHHETTLPAKTSGKGVQCDVHNGSAFGGDVAPDHAGISNDDHLSDDEIDNEQDDILSPLPSSMTHYSNLDFQSETSYWSMEHTKKKKLRDFLVGTALILLFAAGVMRTSVPSLLYAILSVQALYSGRRAGIKSLFPVLVVGITTAIAAGMMLLHFIVNHTSADYSPLLLQVLLRTRFVIKFIHLLAIPVARLLHHFSLFNRPRVCVVFVGRSSFGSSFCTIPWALAAPRLRQFHKRGLRLRLTSKTTRSKHLCCSKLECVNMCFVLSLLTYALSLQRQPEDALRCFCFGLAAASRPCAPVFASMSLWPTHFCEKKPAFQNLS